MIRHVRERKEEEMLTIDEVDKIIREKKVPHGLNVTFTEEIDTSSCTDFFGKRCPYNIHVTGINRAHKDRVDPTYDWKRHLDEDVGIPHEVVPLSIGAGAGSAIGALVGGKRGAAIGAILGSLAGAFFEIVTKRD